MQRGIQLEGRRPRRLVATRDINHIETFVPVAGEAAGRGCVIGSPFTVRFLEPHRGAVCLRRRGAIPVSESAILRALPKGRLVEW